MIDTLTEAPLFVRIILFVWWLGCCGSLAFLTHSKDIAKRDIDSGTTLKWATKFVFAIFWFIFIPLAVFVACFKKKST